MKKLLLVCVLLICVVLAGCATKEPAFSISVYDEVLTQVKEVLALPEDAIIPEGMEGIREFGSVYGDEALNLLCYKYQDVNNDGIPELLIGFSMNEPNQYIGNQIYLAYTVLDGNPEQFLYATAKNSYSLLSDGTFANFGSDGAAYSFFGEFRLSEANGLDFTDYYFTHEIDGDFENIGVYYNSTGNFDVASSNLTDLTLSDFNELQEELILGILPLEDPIPFSDLK